MDVLCLGYRPQVSEGGVSEISADVLIKDLGLVIFGVRLLSDAGLEKSGMILPQAVFSVDGKTVYEDALSFPNQWDRLAFHAKVIKAVELRIAEQVIQVAETESEARAR